MGADNTFQETNFNSKKVDKDLLKKEIIQSVKVRYSLVKTGHNRSSVSTECIISCESIDFEIKLNIFKDKHQNYLIANKLLEIAVDEYLKNK